MRMLNEGDRGGSTVSLERSKKRAKYLDLLPLIYPVLGDETDPIVWVSTLSCLAGNSWKKLQIR